MFFIVLSCMCMRVRSGNLCKCDTRSIIDCFLISFHRRSFFIIVLSCIHMRACMVDVRMTRYCFCGGFLVLFVFVVLFCFVLFLFVFLLVFVCLLVWFVLFCCCFVCLFVCLLLGFFVVVFFGLLLFGCCCFCCCCFFWGEGGDTGLIVTCEQPKPK